MADDYLDINDRLSPVDSALNYRGSYDALSQEMELLE